MKKKQEKNTDTLVIKAIQAVTGSLIQANDGCFYRLVAVDPILDPRGGVYEDDTDEVIASFDRPEGIFREILKGDVHIKAA